MLIRSLGRANISLAGLFRAVLGGRVLARSVAGNNFPVSVTDHKRLYSPGSKGRQKPGGLGLGASTHLEKNLVATPSQG